MKLYARPFCPPGRWQEYKYFPLESQRVLLEEDFVAHQDCWTLLDRELPDSTDPQAFVDTIESVYRSFPDLRGPYDHGDRQHDGWEWQTDCEEGVDEGLWPWQSHLGWATAVPDHSTRSPLDVMPELKEFLKTRRMLDPNLVTALTGDQTGSGNVVRLDDCFAVLAPELIIMIASYLPTHDALALRTVSRSFGFIFNDQQFWASRFTPGGDCSWLADIRRAQLDQVPDWRSLYHSTRPSSPEVYFSNARKVVATVRMLTQLTSLTKMAPLWQLDPAHQVFPGGAEIVSGLMPNQYNADFREGCRVFFINQIWSVRGPIVVSVYTVQLGSGGKAASYICGIKIVFEDQTVSAVGYRSSTEHTVSVGRLTGFEVSVARRGIKAIRCQSGPGVLTPWLGHPEGGVKTDRLLSGHRVNAIGGMFDVSDLLFFNVYSRVLADN